MTASRIVAFFSFLLVLVISSTLFAQTQTGSITGKVTDETDAVLPGVTVTITSEALITGTQVTTTDALGLYNFRALPPGSYNVTFELSGFATTRQELINVEAFFVATVNVVMTVATLGVESPWLDLLLVGNHGSLHHNNQRVDLSPDDLEEPRESQTLFERALNQSLREREPVSLGRSVR